MSITVQIEPASGAPPEVEYRWDPDTDILTAHLKANGVAEGMSGSVEIEGADGSWIVLDVHAGRIRGVEVAVWPDVRKLPSLAPPADAQYARITVPAKRAQTGIASLEEETPLSAEADAPERTFHFKLGPARSARAVRLARDILLDVDGGGAIVGLWLLNVPPFPGEG